MRIAAGVIGVLLLLAIIYFFLPAGVKRVVNPFYRPTTTAVRTSPSPSAGVTITPPVGSAAPDAFVNATGTPRPSGSVLAQATGTARATATPRASTTVDPFASASPSGTQIASANLPGTGDEERNPELLVIQLLASILVIMFGYKLSRHL